MMIQNITRFLSMCACATLFATGIASAAPPVIMKVLVLAGSTNENSYQSISTYLQEIGVPYQAVALNSDYARFLG